MKGIKGLATYALLGGVALGLAACGGTAQQELGEDYAYVNDISGMEPDPIYPRSWVKPGFKDVDQYSHFIIQDVEVVKSGEGLDLEDVARVQAYFRDAVKEKLQEGGYSVVDAPQDDTMIIKLSIVGLEVPSGAAANVATSLMIGVSTSVGEVTVEGAFIDAATGEVQAVVADSRRGSYANASPWSSWQDIEDSMDDWAQEMRMSFDDIHERAGKKMEQ